MLLGRETEYVRWSDWSKILRIYESDNICRRAISDDFSELFIFEILRNVHGGRVREFNFLSFSSTLNEEQKNLEIIDYLYY